MVTDDRLKARLILVGYLHPHAPMLATPLGPHSTASIPLTAIDRPSTIKLHEGRGAAGGVLPIHGLNEVSPAMNPGGMVGVLAVISDD